MGDPWLARSLREKNGGFIATLYCDPTHSGRQEVNPTASCFWRHLLSRAGAGQVVLRLWPDQDPRGKWEVRDTG